jgi:probable DNA repair protein
MPSALTLAELLDILARGELVLLPSARAARELRAAFDARQRALGLPVWESAPALSWQQWTGSLWSELIAAGGETRLLLNAAQEHSLWREIILDDATLPTLGSADSLADLAQSAWKLAAAYQATSRLRGAGLNHDSRIFSQWAETFTRRCAKEGLLSSALLDEALRQHAASGTLPAPATLRLAGFGEISPAQESLLTTLRERGTSVTSHSLVTSPQPLRAAVVAEHPREELELAARWVRSYLEEHPEGVPRVGILVPNLIEERGELESILREILAPELQSISADLSSTPWEISVGEPLDSLAMISAALELAQWTTGPISIERAGALLLSPFLGSASERDDLARFDARILRRHTLLRPELDIASLLRLLAPREMGTPQLAAWLHEIQALAQSAATIRSATFAEWMEHIRRLLTAAHWPGSSPESLTAAQFEAARAWDAVLDLVATLDYSGRRVPFRAALEALRLQAQRTPFAPPTTHAPVQVMSVAESEGCLFDAVVFLRATDANWPPPLHTHPLLPWQLQRSLAMPGTDATQTTQRARDFTTALLARTGTAIFTSAAEDSEGKLRPSPLLTEFALATIQPEDLCPAPTPVERIEPETVPDDTPLPPLATNEVKGGARVLQLQAACGFRAFAEFRLQAADLETRDLGFDARDTGNQVHKALETFWKEIKSQKELRNATPETIDSILRNSIETALQRNFAPRGSWDTAYLDLQRRRLRKLLQQWLELELERGPFVVIDAEHRTRLPVGPLDLDLRLDRMDRVGDEDGEDVVLVDYKTGLASPKKWEGNRPDEPQLPLYALYPPPETVKAVTFANVRPGKQMKWSGYQAEAGILPKNKRQEDLNRIIAEWRITLTQLAQDFADGKAFVAPKDYPTTCEHCGQRVLCRLNPATLLEHEDEESAEVSDG